MGQAPFPVITACKAVQRPARFYRYFMRWQFLKQRIFHYNMPVLNFSFPFHSFPVLSLICNVISFVASIGKEYPFPKMPCILLVGKYPKPSDFPLTTYNTGQSDFAEVLRKIFQKVFLTSYYGGRAGNAKDMQKKNAAICDASIIF